MNLDEIHEFDRPDPGTKRGRLRPRGSFARLPRRLSELTLLVGPVEIHRILPPLI